MTAPPLIDERSAQWAAGLAMPRGTPNPFQVATLQRDVHADMPDVDEAARSWSRLGRDLPATKVRVVGRTGWVRANLQAMRGAFDPLADRLSGSRILASRVLGLQLGALFGLLSRRVLGQYVLPLGGPGGGQLVVVGPNLLDLAEEHGPLAGDIRRAVLVHEVTHRLQFDGVSWLGEHMRGLLDRYLQGSRVDVGAVAEIAGRLPEAVAEAIETSDFTPVIHSVLSPAQVEVIGEAQGLMSLLEGHGNAAMFAGTEGVVADTEAVRRALARRHSDPTTRLLASVVGLELKRRQYQEGEAFVQAVIAEGGVAALNRAFEAPDHLPDRDEIADPQAWLDRVGRPDGAATGTDGP